MAEPGAGRQKTHPPVGRDGLLALMKWSNHIDKIQPKTSGLLAFYQRGCVFCAALAECRDYRIYIIQFIKS